MVVALPGPRLLVLATAAERVAELLVSRRHRQWAVRHGGLEFGRAHYPAMMVAHGALLAGCGWHAWHGERPSGWSAPSLVGATLLAQGLRWWCVASLGRAWNTRIVVIPGSPLVRRGPYRWWRHPNYAAVVIEGVALPLAVGAPGLAAIFTAANGALLGVRVRSENRALALLSQSDSS
jgi:methyltransferase